MNRELLVVDDIASTAVNLFLEIAPKTVALSGGSTPRPVYERLARTPYDWAAVELFFGDERCVPPNDKDSNYRMAHESLLAHVPARVHSMDGEHCDADGYERDLRSSFGSGTPQFDLLFQGLGPDGHTASLFPGDAALTVQDRLVVRVDRPDHSRLSLTLPVLNAAAVAMFLVSGVEKGAALQRLMAGEDIPAARITAPRVVVIADAAAAGR